jgi:hypothetical protein
MSGELSVVRDASGEWHRTDILACAASGVFEPVEERRVDPEELGRERCSNCTW